MGGKNVTGHAHTCQKKHKDVINMQEKTLNSFDTTRSEEAKAEAVKKCAKLTLKCLRICKKKKVPKKDFRSDQKEHKK